MSGIHKVAFRLFGCPCTIFDFAEAGYILGVVTPVYAQSQLIKESKESKSLILLIFLIFLIFYDIFLENYDFFEKSIQF